MEYLGINNLTDAEVLLKDYCKNGDILQKFHEDLLLWPEEWTYTENINTNIDQKIITFSEKLLQNKCEENTGDMQMSLECIIFNQLYDYIAPSIYCKFGREDACLYQICQQLSNSNVTAEQFGAPGHYAIPLLAAVVELSSLDNKKSPIEKMSCLCTTYDLMYAELKAAFIDLIAKNSDAEIEIPIINNCDILPLLMIVIVRSKSMHLYSNLYLIYARLNRYICENYRFILAMFTAASEKLSNMTKTNLHLKSGKLYHLNLEQLIKLTNACASNTNGKKVLTTFDQQVQRITDLISASTAEYHSI